MTRPESHAIYPATGPASTRPPARWLVGTIVVLLCLAAFLANQWVEKQRSQTQPSLVSGQPGFTLESLPDPSGSLSIDDILARSGTLPFSKALKKGGHVRYVWHRLTISNESNSVRRAILGVSYDFVQEAELYQVGADGVAHVQRTGGTVRWSQRAVPGQKRAFAVTLPAGSQTVFYVRINDSLKQPKRFFLWNEERTFDRLNRIYQLQFVGYFALWIGLVAYNGFLYAVLRRRDYLLYLIYVLSMGAVALTASDLSTIFFPWPHWSLRGIVVTVLINIATFNLVRFSRVFLETGARAPGMDRWLRRFGWAVLAASLAAPAWLWPAPAACYVAFDFGLNIIVLTALPIVGFALFLRRAPQAGLFVLTFLPPIAALIMVLRANIGLPDARANGLPLLCANALELVLLALALAWRYRRITDDAERLRSEYTSRLEDDVTRRTQELRESNHSLAQANHDKDRIFGIIGHDLRGPAQSLFSLAQILSTSPDAFSPEESASMAKEIEEACHAQLELLDNLLQWGRIQAGGLQIKPELQAVTDIANAAAGTVAQAARDKGIPLSIEVEPGLGVYADPQAAQAVMRNLIGNALKFTRSGGTVVVTGRRSGDWVELAVRDTGVGMSAERRGELFSRPVKSLEGTRSEKGAGVGLVLCRDLARANGGDLRIESEAGRGTTATLILPANPRS